MRSSEVLRLIGTYNMLHMNIRPSEIIGVEDTYTAYCFDEAIAFIMSKLKEGEEPIFNLNENGEVKNYKKPSDIYKKYEK